MPQFYFRKFDFHPRPLTRQQEDDRMIRTMIIRVVVTLLIILLCAIPVIIALASGSTP